VADPSTTDALEVAYRALRVRDRSERELDERLAARGVPEVVREEALATLRRTGLVDDRRFAERRASALASRGAGNSLIRHELASAGISDDLADEALGAPDPRRGILDLETELILADLEVVERRLERLEASIKKQRKDAEVKEREILTRLKAALEAETPLRAVPLSAEDTRAVRGFTFLSQKPIFHIVNLDEKAIADGERVVERFGLEEVAGRARTRVGWVSAVIETEIARLEGEEQQAFLGDLGLAEPAIRRVLRECYALLGLVSFFTCGEDEVRAWPIPEGTRAQDAAGVVHSDIARGFIRAEVNGYDELVAVNGSFADLRARGQLRLEGKDYIVRDGEVCHFRFNVAK